MSFAIYGVFKYLVNTLLLVCKSSRAFESLVFWEMGVDGVEETAFTASAEYGSTEGEEKGGVTFIINGGRCDAVIPNDDGKMIFSDLCVACDIHGIVDLIVREISVLSERGKIAVDIDSIIAVGRNMQAERAAAIRECSIKFAVFIGLWCFGVPDPLGVLENAMHEFFSSHFFLQYTMERKIKSRIWVHLLTIY